MQDHAIGIAALRSERHAGRRDLEAVLQRITPVGQQDGVADAGLGDGAVQLVDRRHPNGARGLGRPPSAARTAHVIVLRGAGEHHRGQRDATQLNDGADHAASPIRCSRCQSSRMSRTCRR